MAYQDCARAVQTADEVAGDLDAGWVTSFRLANANINPSTGLATDYLNHFNEAIMLLEMVASCPDCLTDFHGWQPLTYRQHFLASRFKGRDLVIAAYDAADPAARTCLEKLTETMTTEIEATRATMNAGLSPEASGALTDRATAKLKLLVARAAAIINGGVDTAEPTAPQALVDVLMRRSA